MIVINQLLDNNLNKDEIKKNLISKIKQKIPEKKLNDEERVQQLFKELKFYNMDLIKEEIIAIIKENNFQKEIIQNKINEKIALQIYDELIKLNDVDISIASKEELFKKIIELNCNLQEIKLFYMIDKLYKELEEKYLISNFVDEEEAKKKIRELNCNKQLLVEWIEDKL